MNQITFHLTYNDIHTALENYVKEKAQVALEVKEEGLTTGFTAFFDKTDKQISLETATITIKKHE